ncbi:flavin reductase family protein [Brumimicrobium oceani]|uniref:Flavin oxidoreductase n=1 Tax=Brumimicrobium oceani TaxID=2100725 RepID=A0A2U2XC42_9FLAO|nr:flavin reductase [Brumimicrobium oceani]PWH85365.1 flavin oxidoreductase [Brumimicrobium oceani]
MTTITSEQINDFDKRYRTNLINCLSGIKSMNLIGTKNTSGQTNLAIFNSVIHLGAHPPLMGFIQRPATVERHTFENIQETKYFTINSVTKEVHKQAHQTSARYERAESEFDETSLESTFINDFHAPFVAKSPLKIGLELADIIPIPVNNTQLVIGKVKLIQLNEEFLKEDGFLSLHDQGIVGGTGLDSYLSAKEIGRYSYAKPDLPLSKYSHNR